MTVKNEAYKRAKLTISEFDSEDCITTSGEETRNYELDLYEMRGVGDYSSW